MKRDDDELRDELRQLAGQTPPPSDDFAGAVMRRAALRPTPRRGWWQALWAPRQLTISLRPASLLATGLVLAIGLAAAVRLVPRGAREQPVAPSLASASTAPAPASAAPASGPVLVRFSLRAGEARQVSLAGDFNDWRAEAQPLTRGPDGTWSATVPLPRGSWSYSFVVDGKWVADPGAEAWRDDGFGGRNAVVRIGS